MKSSSQYSFAQVPAVNIARSSFNRSRTYKTTLDSGYLVPFLVEEILPGDTVKASTTSFFRLTTPVVPFMDNLFADFFYFFVPNRLVWENWEHFNGARDNPVADYDNDTQYLIPQMTPVSGQSFAVGGIADYFGLPTGVSGLSVSALPFRAYNLIWNEWFRDQNLQNSATVDLGDSATDDTNYPLRRRGKRHDYFTSCLPWPQKGPGVEIPLGGSAPVVFGDSVSTADYPAGSWSPSSFIGQQAALQRLSISPNTPIVGSSTGGSNAGVTLVTDLSQATAATINSLREAFQIQRQYELDARGGTRYFEILRANYGVVSPDSRLQRPEYLGGGEIPIHIHTVPQTSGTVAGGLTPQGNLSAIGVASGKNGFSKSFVEHGYLIGLVSIRADLTYQNGIDRMWSRKSRFDFYWPALAHLGEQAVLNKEIYAQGTSADDQVFGYQERWAEYRYGVSHITGELRSSYGQSLDVWHLAQKFTSLPTLNSTFIEDNPPVARVLAVQNKPQFIMDALIKFNHVRPLPVYSVPGLIDHVGRF